MGLASVAGFLIGFLFGISSITTLLGFMGNVLIQIDEMLRNLSAMSTLVLLIIAIVLVVKIKAIASLIAGAIVGAVLNLILAQNGINVLELLKNSLGF
ncbi:MAG: hypothetical protein ACK401_08590 [Archaeoglobaceae archaeon]